MTATQLEALVELLASADVEFVVVGGLAAVVHGSAYVTNDVDVCYGRSAANVERLCRALSRVHLFGRSVRVLTLEALIRAKRAAGRKKDLLLIPELEALLELRQPPGE